MSKRGVPSVRIRQVFRATPEAVFDAWVTPRLIRRWLFVGPASEIIGIELDARVGGRFSILERTADGSIDHFGRFTDFDRPRRLGFTLEVPSHFLGVTNVAVDIAQISEGASRGTEMIFEQTGVSADVPEQSWRDMFSQLAGVLARTA